MLRNRNLVPLSHQHQHALALCVSIHRAFDAGESGLGTWQDAIQQAFENELEFHFQAEEQLLFPVAARYDQLKPLVSELIAEHTVLRSYALAALARSMSRSDLLDFAATLSLHVRKEERQLFELCQELLTPEELTGLGKKTIDFFQDRCVPLEPDVTGPEANF